MDFVLYIGLELINIRLYIISLTLPNIIPMLNKLFLLIFNFAPRSLRLFWSRLSNNGFWSLFTQVNFSQTVLFSKPNLIVEDMIAQAWA
jgi:hypothetical protein